VKDLTIEQTSPKKRILCVEDDRDTCELLNILLAEYTVVFAHSLQESLSLLENQSFDLYLLDNWLPDGSGIEICRKIREQWPEVPIIFTSAVGQKSEIKKAMNAGAGKYMLKPCEPQELYKVVKELLEAKNKNSLSETLDITPRHVF
jgi:DNA-binding response OmpR family regulator